MGSVVAFLDDLESPNSILVTNKLVEFYFILNSKYTAQPPWAAVMLFPLQRPEAGGGYPLPSSYRMHGGPRHLRVLKSRTRVASGEEPARSQDPNPA